MQSPTIDYLRQVLLSRVAYGESWKMGDWMLIEKCYVMRDNRRTRVSEG